MYYYQTIQFFLYVPDVLATGVKDVSITVLGDRSAQQWVQTNAIMVHVNCQGRDSTVKEQMVTGYRRINLIGLKNSGNSLALPPFHFPSLSPDNPLIPANLYLEFALTRAGSEWNHPDSLRDGSSPKKKKSWGSIANSLPHLSFPSHYLFTSPHDDEEEAEETHQRGKRANASKSPPNPSTIRSTPWLKTPPNRCR